MTASVVTDSVASLPLAAPVGLGIGVRRTRWHDSDEGGTGTAENAVWPSQRPEESPGGSSSLLTQEKNRSAAA